jgi:hypothetical protein
MAALRRYGEPNSHPSCGRPVREDGCFTAGAILLAIIISLTLWFLLRPNPLIRAETQNPWLIEKR